MSMLVSFVLSFFPRDVLDGILNLIGSVSEGFPSYSFIFLTCSDDLICCSNDLISCLHNLSSCSNNIIKLL